MNILDMWAICLSPSIMPENILPENYYNYTYFALICEKHPKKAITSSYLMATTMFNYIAPASSYLVVKGF